MKTKDIGGRLASIGRWSALGVFVLAAGCFYSCGSGQAQPVLTGVEGAAEGVRETEANEMEEAGRKQQLLTEESRKAGQEHSGQPLSEDGQTQQAQTPLQDGQAQQSQILERLAVCYVYVCGEVASPGVYELMEGQRIYEAVSLAGGFTEEAAEDWLNLAEPVQDGMKIQVPNREQLAELSVQALYGQTSGGGSGGSQEARKINLNTATKEELMTLTGIGESRAEDIIRYRTNQGGFQTIEDIMKVSGIKEASFEKIKDRITV